jgi:tRNA(Ile2) C34 agmatinyltransferase TiaS
MVKDSKTSAVQQESYEECCHRCGGFMVPEPVFELGSVNWRCIGCGERIDPVILAHRKKNVERDEAEKLFKSQGGPRLN